MTTMTAMHRVAILLAAALPAAVLCGCSRDKGEKEPVVTVQVVTARRTTISRIVTAEAILFPLHEAALTPKVSAPVRKFYVNRGDKVHRGQLLAVLENSDLEAAQVENRGALEQAQANYETKTSADVPQERQKAELEVQQDHVALDAAQKQYDSRAELYRQGALPRKELDASAVALAQARSQYELAQKHLAALQAGGTTRQLKAAHGEFATAQGKYLGASAQLAYSRIRSPIDGVVTDRINYPGEVPPAGAPLITVMDLSQVIAKAHIPQDQAALLKPGDAATIHVAAESFPARVMLVSPALDPNSTTVEVWIETANPEHRLRPGSAVGISAVAQQVPHAIVVPAAAVLTDPQGSTSAMVAGADGRAHQRPVHTGIHQDDKVQITAGLNAGDQVVSAGAYGLPDNTRIQVAPQTGQTPPPAEGGR